MHFLITGATGFVGRGLLPWLAAHGHTGIATGRTLPTKLPPGWQAAARDRVLSCAADATNVDAIVHLEVKQHLPSPTPADLDDLEFVNVAGTREWLDWAARAAPPTRSRRQVCTATRPISALRSRAARSTTFPIVTRPHGPSLPP